MIKELKEAKNKVNEQKEKYESVVKEARKEYDEKVSEAQSNLHEAQREFAILQQEARDLLGYGYRNMNSRIIIPPYFDYLFEPHFKITTANNTY